MAAKEAQGQWKDRTAGGCFNYPTWRWNPQYFLKLSKNFTGKLKVSLTQAKTKNIDHIGLYILKNDGTGRRMLSAKQAVAKSGFKTLPTVHLEAELDGSNSPYIVVPCSFDPKKEGKFKVSTDQGTLKEITPDRDWYELGVQGSWKGITAAGCKNHKTFKKNKQYHIVANVVTDKVVVVVSQTEKPEFNQIGVYLIQSEESTDLERISSKDFIAKSTFEDGNEAVVYCHLNPGKYVIIPCTFEPQHEASFYLSIWSNRRIEGAGQGIEWQEDGVLVNVITAEDKLAMQVQETDKVRDELIKEKEQHLKTREVLQEKTLEIETINSKVNDLHKQIERLEKFNKSSAVDEDVGVKLKVQLSRLQDLLKNSERLSTGNAAWKSEITDIRAIIKTMETALGIEPEVEPPVQDFVGPKISGHGILKGKRLAVELEWKGKSAGGCMNHPTWRWNTQIHLLVPEGAKITASLVQLARKTLSSVAMYIIDSATPEVGKLHWLESRNQLIAKTRFKTTTKLSMDIGLPKSPNAYVLIPCTFEPNDEHPFTVEIEADKDITIEVVAPHKDWIETKVTGEWKGVTAGGCKNHGTFVNNPQYLVDVPEKMKIRTLLLQTKIDHFDAISFYWIKPKGKATKLAGVADEEVVVKGRFGDPNECHLTVELEAGTYVLIPSTFEVGKEASFELFLCTRGTRDIKVRELK